MEYCGKHDITYQKGQTCWCCDLDKKKGGSIQPKPSPTKPSGSSTFAKG